MARDWPSWADVAGLLIKSKNSPQTHADMVLVPGPSDLYPPTSWSEGGHPHPTAERPPCDHCQTLRPLHASPV